MFPIPWNKAYRKKDGSLTIIDDMFVDAPELQEEIDALDDKIDAVGDRVTDLETDTANCWVIDAHDRTLVLSTADGTKTVTDMLTEADAALKATVIADGYAYEPVQLVVANGSGNAAQTAIDIYCNGQRLVTNFSSYSLRGSRSIQASNGNSIVNYSLFLPDHYFGTYSVSLNNGEISGYKKYETEKPQSGTTTYMRYHLWKKL